LKSSVIVVCANFTTRARSALISRVVNVGSLFQVFRGDAGAAFAPGAGRPSELFLGLLLEGFWLAPRGMGAIPTVATEQDVDDLADAIAGVLGAMERSSNGAARPVGVA